MNKKLLIASVIVLGIVAGFSSKASAAVCTNNFPTSLNSYASGACIPSAWANALEAKLGIDSSTATSSLDYLLNNLFTSYKSDIIKATSTQGLLQTLNNLSDLTNLVAARTNLGLGSIATHPTTDFVSSSSLAGVNGNCAQWTGTTTLGNSGAACGSGGTSSTVSGNFTVTGNGTSTISGNATTTSVINVLNNIWYVPQNYATAGCAGDPTATKWQTCVYAIYKAMAPNGGGTIMQTFSVTSTWTGLLSFNINAVQVQLMCSPNVTLTYTGTSTIPSGSWLPSGENIALNFNFGNPYGHGRTSQNGNCDLRGSSSPIAAGNSMTATSTGIYFGGTYSYLDNTLTATTSNAGAVGVLVDYNVNGFGRNIWYGANAYVDEYRGTSSGGNCAAKTGCLLFVDIANNSGERWVIQGGTYTDPGNSTATNAIYLTNAGTASLFFNFNSADDAQIVCGASDGLCDVSQNHIENAAYNTYGNYIPIVNPSSDRSTSINASFIEFANDATTGSGKTWTTLIKHGAQLTAIGDHIDNYGGATITNFSDHSNDNGVESELICMLQVQGGGLTNIVAGSGGVPYSLANGSPCNQNVANSYTIGMRAEQNNTNEIFSGGNVVGTFDHSGNWTLGVTGTSGSLGVQGNVNATGSITATGNIKTFNGLITVPTVGSVSSTLTGNSAAAQVFTGSGVATTTLPAVGSTAGQKIEFKNRGTAALSIAAASSEFLWLSAVNASSSAYSLLPGSSTAFLSDGAYWDQL